MYNPFTCELTHEQSVLNNGGKCLSCLGDTEPIVGMEPIDGPDGTPIDVVYSLEGYWRYCDGCASMLMHDMHDQHIATDDGELPF